MTSRHSSTHIARCGGEPTRWPTACRAPPAAAAVWPAARRADRVELDHEHLDARSLGGFVRIGWEEITTVRRSRTGLGRITLAVEAAAPIRRIEIAESLPGFDQLAQLVRERAAVGEVVELRRPLESPSRQPRKPRVRSLRGRSRAYPRNRRAA